MSLILIGIAVAFNFCVVIKKWRMHRYFDCLIDTGILAVICVLFSGTFSALATGAVASMLVSFYLYFNPLTFAEVTGEDEDDFDD